MPEVPALSLDEVASLLGLTGRDAERLACGDFFDGPSGLRCRLELETENGRVTSVRPTVLLGLKACDLAGDEVHLLLVLQARLLAKGMWYLGASAEGELQITALKPQHDEREAATAVDLANFTAWSTLQLMLESLPLAKADVDRGKMQ